MMSGITGLFGLLTGYILPFLLVLLVIVFIHEMGHYLVGRWCGIRVVAFSLGFGPELAGFTDKHGTRWKLSAIPLGGYVKFFGDENAASKPDNDTIENMSEADRAHAFASAHVGKRFLTVLAGPVANFILAVVVFTALFMTYGRKVIDPVVGHVAVNSAAQEAGILPGDVIIAIDGKKIESFDAIREYVFLRPSRRLTVTLERDQQELKIPVTPKRNEVTDGLGNKIEIGQIGVSPDPATAQIRDKTYNFPQAVGASFGEIKSIIGNTFRYIHNIFIGSMNADQIGGPIRIAQTVGQVAKYGIADVLQLGAMLSVSIGLLNLMPVPLLDGGHLVFYVIEAIRGRPLGGKVQDVAFRIGFVMILSLMAFATWNDTFGRWIG